MKLIYEEINLRQCPYASFYRQFKIISYSSIYLGKPNRDATTLRNLTLNCPHVHIPISTKHSDKI